MDVPDGFRPYAEAAIVRLGYLRPALEFAVEDGSVRVRGADGADAAGLRRDVLHAIYREKIYSETLQLRRTLLDALIRR